MSRTLTRPPDRPGRLVPPGRRPDVHGRAGRLAGRCAVVAVLTLAGCGPRAPVHPASSGTAATSSGSITGSALSAGLLPAEAFGSRSTVVNLTLDQLRQLSAGSGTAPGARVDPPSCAVAVQGGAPDFTGVADLTAESAVGPGGSTVEALLTGAPVQGAVDRVEGAVAACPRATVTAPGGITTTITFRAVPVPAVGEAAAAMQVTTSRASAPASAALVGVVRDRDRLLLLLAGGSAGAAAPASFGALLQRAYRVQARALD